jgi:hypothetical protein
MPVVQARKIIFEKHKDFERIVMKLYTEYLESVYHEFLTFESHWVQMAKNSLYF